MFGISFKSILKAMFAEGKLKPNKDAKRPRPLFEEFDVRSGLASMVTIRDVNKNPFVSLSDLEDYLVLLGAFHQLQTAPDFGRRMIDYADDYEKYAAITVPRYRRESAKVSGKRVVDMKEGFSLENSCQSTSSSPASSISGRSEAKSSVETVLKTPRTDQYAVYDIDYSPLTYLLPAEKLAYGEFATPEPLQNSDNEQIHFFHAQPSSILPECAAEPCSLPLPPIGILLAWHGHLMRPDIYHRASGNAFKALRGVPFPLHEAAQAIRQGCLPQELDRCDRLAHVRAEYYGGPPTATLASMIECQTVFIEYCHQAGLLKKELLRQNAAAGTSAIVRYHGFLEIMRDAELWHRLEHTLDIEVVWKCHRLNNILYCDDVAGFADQEYFAAGSGRHERWSTTVHYAYDYKKETQLAWGKRFKGKKFYETT